VRVAASIFVHTQDEGQNQAAGRDSRQSEALLSRKSVKSDLLYGKGRLLCLDSDVQVHNLCGEIQAPAALVATRTDCLASNRQHPALQCLNLNAVQCCMIAGGVTEVESETASKQRRACSESRRKSAFIGTWASVSVGGHGLRRVST
jgi:hypothetical protein